MPASADFLQRLERRLPGIVDEFGTSFHIYDEAGLIRNVERFAAAFREVEFREFFPVKALPNPHMLRRIFATGAGFDCSSLPELAIAKMSGAAGSDVMFTSNNTSRDELRAAIDTGAILNLDDICLLAKLEECPPLLSFRYNPGSIEIGAGGYLGQPELAKFGVPKPQLREAYLSAARMGAVEFGIHGMFASNQLDCDHAVAAAEVLIETASQLSRELGLRFAFVNLGGGLGIPYHPDERPFDLATYAERVRDSLARSFTTFGLQSPRIYMECGRYVASPHGVLVTRAINIMRKWRMFVGVDASMPALMRPGMYGAYHHITVAGGDHRPLEIVDVVGSLCENNDKFAVQRLLPRVVEGDLLVIHDTGGHGHSMGFNYNGRLRPKELVLHADDTVELIRREETTADYCRTLVPEPDAQHVGGER
jgi:diaminopimelate decarboxylase